MKLDMVYVDEVAYCDSAVVSADTMGVVIRQGGEVVSFSVDTPSNKPNMLGWLAGKFQEYKPVSRFGGIIEWVKK